MYLLHNCITYRQNFYKKKQAAGQKKQAALPKKGLPVAVLQKKKFQLKNSWKIYLRGMDGYLLKRSVCVPIRSSLIMFRRFFHSKIKSLSICESYTKS